MAAIYLTSKGSATRCMSTFPTYATPTACGTWFRTRTTSSISPAKPAISIPIHNPVPDLEINCLAQLSLLEACRTCNPAIKIVFASTRQIYGRPISLPVTEAHPLQPVDINGINKMAAEKYHLLYSDVYGLHATALRLTNTIGPRMRIKDARQTFVGLWIRQLLENKPIEVWGGKQLRDLTDVEDAVDAFLLAANNPATKGQVYNLGGSEVIELAGLAKLMVEINGAGKYSVCDFPPARRSID